MTGLTGQETKENGREEDSFDAVFDYDGVITDAGVAETGRDTGATIDVTPLRTLLDKNYVVGVMSCNDPSYVADTLEAHGIPAIADTTMTHKTPPWWCKRGIVLVSSRKLLSCLYIDDRALGWKFGDGTGIILGALQNRQEGA